jgi:hypothetical protein
MALDFDGVDDEVTHGDIAGMSGAANLTVAGWFMVDVAEVIGIFWSKWASNLGIQLQIGAADTTKIRVVFSNWTPFMLSDAGTITTGVWYHLAVVYNGGGVTDADKVKVYKNGAAINLTPGGTIPTTLATTADPFRVANEGAAGGGGFADIKAANIQVWLASLTAGEIAQQANMTIPVRTANLSLWAPYDDGTSVKDYSGAGNHGTVASTPVQVSGPSVSWGAPNLT